MSSPASVAHRETDLRQQRALKLEALEAKRIRAIALLEEGVPLYVIADRLRMSRGWVAAVRDSR